MACLDFLPFFFSLFLFADCVSHFSVRTRSRTMLCIAGRAVFIVACFAYSFVYSGTIRVVKVIKTKQIMMGSYILCLFVL